MFDTVGLKSARRASINTSSHSPWISASQITLFHEDQLHIKADKLSLLCLLYVLRRVRSMHNFVHPRSRSND